MQACERQGQRVRDAHGLRCPRVGTDRRGHHSSPCRGAYTDAEVDAMIDAAIAYELGQRDGGCDGEPFTDEQVLAMVDAACAAELDT